MVNLNTETQVGLGSASLAHKTSFPPTQGQLAGPPAKRYLVVTCMDARLDPAVAFGIAVGDAHVIRNAGGAALDALRSVVVSQQFLGTTEILLVKHTKCGMVGLTNEKALEVVESELGAEAVSELKMRKVTDFMGIADLEASVMGDVKFLAESKVIKPGTAISGWIYHVETGATTRVV